MSAAAWALASHEKHISIMIANQTPSECTLGPGAGPLWDRCVVHGVGVARDRVEVGALRRHVVRERVESIQLLDPTRHATTKHERTLECLECSKTKHKHAYWIWDPKGS